MDDFIKDLEKVIKAGIGAVVMNVMFGVIMISIGLASKGMVDQGYMQAAHGAEGIVILILTYLPNWLCYTFMLVVLGLMAFIACLAFGRLKRNAA